MKIILGTLSFYVLFFAGTCFGNSYSEIGSDEKKNFGDCNFDDGTLCEWSSSSLRTHWKNQMPANVSPGNAPKVDGNQLAIGGYAAIYSPGVLRFMNTRKC